uniref:Uncharacterized protein n=1 Tax=Hucho hucho TaxID=62062 RepID=A0A4W5Q9Q3_9TELE
MVDQLGGDLNSTPLHWATRQGHLSMVVQLLKYGSDPSLIDGEGCSCVHLAAQFGHTSIVAYLIAKGQVRPNCKLAPNPYFLCTCVDLRGFDRCKQYCG